MATSAETLPGRLQDIVRLRVSGLSKEEIGERVGLAGGSVQTYIAEIHGRLELESCRSVRLGLVAYAIENDLVPEDCELGRALGRWAARIAAGVRRES